MDWKNLRKIVRWPSYYFWYRCQRSISHNLDGSAVGWQVQFWEADKSPGDSFKLAVRLSPQAQDFVLCWS